MWNTEFIFTELNFTCTFIMHTGNHLLGNLKKSSRTALLVQISWKKINKQFFDFNDCCCPIVLNWKMWKMYYDNCELNKTLLAELVMCNYKNVHGFCVLIILDAFWKKKSLFISFEWELKAEIPGRRLSRRMPTNVKRL